MVIISYLHIKLGLRVATIVKFLNSNGVSIELSGASNFKVSKTKHIDVFEVNKAIYNLVKNNKERILESESAIESELKKRLIYLEGEYQRLITQSPKDHLNLFKVVNDINLLSEEVELRDREDESAANLFDLHMLEDWNFDAYEKEIENELKNWRQGEKYEDEDFKVAYEIYNSMGFAGVVYGIGRARDWAKKMDGTIYKDGKIVR